MAEFIFDLALPPVAVERVSQVIGLAETIFGPIDGSDLEWRLGHLPDPSLFLASDPAGLVGFKFGYASTSTRYHSWLGGVALRARRQGIARQLMHFQHSWLLSRGYSEIETGTIGSNESMHQLNLEFGFKVIGSYNRDGMPRIMLHKRLAPADTPAVRPDWPLKLAL
ncbi:MAG: GNAT family N-acetyltransferase [Deltaproteobacteria bacterium]|nr:GNAT family N-acetyltransferase [Deltaproteobacteria bacterium]MBW2362278.1 GNAT family N-acetyltransferase [Deltaproteobacteria bacterium]